MCLGGWPKHTPPLPMSPLGTLGRLPRCHGTPLCLGAHHLWCHALHRSVRCPCSEEKVAFMSAHDWPAEHVPLWQTEKIISRHADSLLGKAALGILILKGAYLRKPSCRQMVAAAAPSNTKAHNPPHPPSVVISTLPLLLLGWLPRIKRSL